MQKHLRRLANLSPAKVWQAATNPWLIPFMRTPLLSSVDAILWFFPDEKRETVEARRLELLTNHRFYEAINAAMIEKRRRRTSTGGWKEFVYLLVRFSQPQVTVETGVFDGESSAVILQALEDNEAGTLVSIDLPAVETIRGSTHRMRETTLPPGCWPGWVVPEYLRGRYRLHLGDSKQALPALYREYPKIDIFMHDSLHTFEHQYFEYTTTWPHLRNGGFLLSDDVHWSPAFHRFCNEQGRAYVRIESGGFGAGRK